MDVRKNCWVLIVLAAFSALNALAQSAEQVLQKTKDTYVAMKSYADVGTVVDEYGSAAKPMQDRHHFTTNFRRAPRAFVLEVKKSSGERNVVWGDPDAFHTWGTTTGQQYDYPNPDNIGAISLSGRATANTSLKIPTLLYGKSPLAAMLLSFADPVLEGKEKIAAHECFRVAGRASDSYAATGKEVNVHRITVWIDASTYLVRQVKEEWKPLPGTVNRTTTTYEPQIDTTIEEAKLRFAAPQH